MTVPIAAAARDTRLPLVLRTVAVVIAVAGFIDPSWVREQRVPPTVSLVATDASATPALMQRTRESLGKRFDVIESRVDGAAAMVYVGRTVPREAERAAAHAIAVIPARVAPDVRIAGVIVPRRASLHAKARLAVTLDVAAAANDSAVVTVRESGALLHREARALSRGESQLVVPMAIAPVRSGTVQWDVEAQVVRAGRAAGAAGAGVSRASVSFAVRDTRYRVYFHDARPSWMSTFVRRAAEQDPRVQAVSRIVTARGISTDAGLPVRLEGLDARSDIDALVVGAPDALTSGEVQGLERFMRQRGGAVVLLLDRSGADGGGASGRLIGAGPFAIRQERVPIALGAPDAAGEAATTPPSLRASEFLVPRSLPEGARPLLLGGPAGASPSAVVWERGVGAGTLVVSGAVDAWRFRDSTQSAFGDFWRDALVRAAEGAPNRLELWVEPSVVRPGEAWRVRASVHERWNPDGRQVPMSAVVRRTGGAPRTDSASANSVDTSQFVQMPTLWPDDVAGVVSNVARAPIAPGRYEVVMTAGRGTPDSSTAFAEFVVSDSALVPAASSEPLLRLWTSARGGIVMSDADLAGLPDLLDRAVGPTVRPVDWHPMHSAWWILPFAAALAGEWWIRRRRGLA